MSGTKTIELSTSNNETISTVRKLYRKNIDLGSYMENDVKTASQNDNKASEITKLIDRYYTLKDSQDDYVKKYPDYQYVNSRISVFDNEIDQKKLEQAIRMLAENIEENKRNAERIFKEKQNKIGALSQINMIKRSLKKNNFMSEQSTFNLDLDLTISSSLYEIEDYLKKISALNQNVKTMNKKISSQQICGVHVAQLHDNDLSEKSSKLTQKINDTLSKFNLNLMDLDVVTRSNLEHIIKTPELDWELTNDISTCILNFVEWKTTIIRAEAMLQNSPIYGDLPEHFQQEWNELSACIEQVLAGYTRNIDIEFIHCRYNQLTADVQSYLNRCYSMRILSESLENQGLSVLHTEGEDEMLVFDPNRDQISHWYQCSFNDSGSLTAHECMDPNVNHQVTEEPSTLCGGFANALIHINDSLTAVAARIESVDQQHKLVRRRPKRLEKYIR